MIYSLMRNSGHRSLVLFLGLLNGMVLLNCLPSHRARGQTITPRSDTIAPTLDSALFYPPATAPENRLRYSRHVLDETFDFQLEPVAPGKFQINIRGGARDVMNIKVYDVIGNLLYEERVRIRGLTQKELDLSNHKSNFFIIEVGNEEVNKTKSIVAL